MIKTIQINICDKEMAEIWRENMSDIFKNFMVAGTLIIFNIALFTGHSAKSDVNCIVPTAKVVDVQYATFPLGNSYIVIVKDGDDDIPEKRIRIKTDTQVYKIGDSVVVKIMQ